MKSAKIFTVFTFLLFFVLQVSAQDEKPKIVWKNLHEKYDRFEDIKPVILNESNKPIYMFAVVKSGIVHEYLKLYRFFETENKWYSFDKHGHPVNKKYQRKIMSDFTIEPWKERTIVFDNEDWMFLAESDGLIPFAFRDNPELKGKGRYRFKLQFYLDDKKSKKLITSESPEFEIIKDQKKFFDK